MLYPSKRDALAWVSFFAALPPDEPLMSRQLELGLAVLAQLDRAAAARRKPLTEAITGLKTLAGRTRYVGPDDRFPKGCRSCLMGTGLGAVRRTSKCNLACPFCYDYGVLDQQPPIGEGLWEIGGTRFHEAGVYQHMYTNGTLCTEENLRMLGEAGLDELRFNLGASRCADQVIESMRIAKRYVPMVGIETPSTAEFEQDFHRKKEAILATGLDFINCAELHLNPNNLMNYADESLYMSRLGYLSPIRSREITLRLMAEADREAWPCVVHDCSNDTKLARDLNMRAHEGGWFGASGYGMEFDSIPWAAFLPALNDPEITFVREEPLPEGYRLGDIVL